MQTLIIVTVIAVIPLFFLLVFVMSSYHKLVAQRARYQQAYTQMEVPLQRRSALIPSLVEKTKAYLPQEHAALPAVNAAQDSTSRARTAVAAKPGDPAAMNQLVLAEAALTEALQQLFAFLAEGKPGFQAHPMPSGFIKEWTAAENEITTARQAYNDGVVSYNAERKSFPGNIITCAFNFPMAESFPPRPMLPLGTGSC